MILLGGMPGTGKDRATRRPGATGEAEFDRTHPDATTPRTVHGAMAHDRGGSRRHRLAGRREGLP
jgi:hypothetical protein